MAESGYSVKTLSKQNANGKGLFKKYLAAGSVYLGDWSDAVEENYGNCKL